MKTLILSKKNLESLLTMPMALRAVKKAYKIHNQDALVQPPIVSIDVESHKGEVDVKSCYVVGDELISIKTASGYYDNSKLKLPSLFATIILLDGRTGFPKCIMDGSIITGYRTGAAGGLSAKILARPDSKVVSIIGAGHQSRMQLRAIKSVLDIEKVRIWSRKKENSIIFKEEMERELSLHVYVADCIEGAVIGGDIIVTTTPSHKPLIRSEWVDQGVHIVAVGADMPGKQELDTKLYGRSKIYVDDLGQCMARGEIRNGFESGDLLKNSIVTSLGQVLTDSRLGRNHSKEITIFDTTGMGVQDNTLANMLYNSAVTQEVGHWLDLMSLED